MKATPSPASSEDSLNPTEDSLADLLVLINSVRPHYAVDAYVQLVPVLLVVGLI